jgi:hypothetical protein
MPKTRAFLSLLCLSAACGDPRIEGAQPAAAPRPGDQCAEDVKAAHLEVRFGCRSRTID